jgi:hypothetical protein
MNIDEMEAGRELDALVAEKVIGLEHADYYRRVIRKGQRYQSWYAPWMDSYSSKRQNPDRGIETAHAVIVQYTSGK